MNKRSLLLRCFWGAVIHLSVCGLLLSNLSRPDNRVTIRRRTANAIIEITTEDTTTIGEDDAELSTIFATDAGEHAHISSSTTIGPPATSPVRPSTVDPPNTTVPPTRSNNPASESSAEVGTTARYSSSVTRSSTVVTSTQLTTMDTLVSTDVVLEITGSHSTRLMSPEGVSTTITSIHASAEASQATTDKRRNGPNTTDVIISSSTTTATVQLTLVIIAVSGSVLSLLLVLVVFLCVSNHKKNQRLRVLEIQTKGRSQTKVCPSEYPDSVSLASVARKQTTDEAYLYKSTPMLNTDGPVEQMFAGIKKKKNMSTFTPGPEKFRKGIAEQPSLLQLLHKKERRPDGDHQTFKELSTEDLQMKTFGSSELDSGWSVNIAYDSVDRASDQLGTVVSENDERHYDVINL